MALRRGPRPGGGCCRAPLRATGGPVCRLLPVEVQMAGDGRSCGSTNSIPVQALLPDGPDPPLRREGWLEGIGSAS
jgi:hypothetical protein